MNHPLEQGKPPELPDPETGKTDEQVERELKTAIAEEQDTKPLVEWLDVLIVACIAAIVVGLYLWTRK